MKTFADFRTELTREIWPAGEAKNLKPSHATFFKLAMMDISKWVPCVQTYNTSQFPFCDTYWENAKTAVDLPNGVIRRIYTLANIATDDWRDKVHYYPSNWTDIERWAKQLYRCTTPLNTGLAKLPTGFFFAEASTDSVCGRARTGIWAINRHRLYVAPWIQSNESLIVEWDGMKDDWLDTDGVNEKWWTLDFKDAVKLFVKWKHEFEFGDKAEGRIIRAAYDERLADLMHWCREKTKQQEALGIDNLITQAQYDDDAVPDVAADATTTNAFVADWGLAGTPLDDIETQVLALAPSLLILGGDNVYNEGTAEALFARFSGLTKTFAWGNHDEDMAPGDLSALLPLVTQGNNERYYSVISGSVQYFILSTDPREPDGGYVDANTSTENSVMGLWLKAMLAVSTAKWKIVIGHHAPYTSDVNNTPGNKWMRWPFKTWGADAYIYGHGHNAAHYQDSGGFNYFQNGLGGHSIRAFGAATTATILKEWNADYSYFRIESTCTSFKVILVDRTGAEIYSYTMTK